MTGFILTVDAPALDLLLEFLFLSPCKFALSIVIVRFVDDIFYYYYYETCKKLIKNAKFY